MIRVGRGACCDLAPVSAAAPGPCESLALMIIDENYIALRI